ncbi:hypothetical protein IGB42_02442 [Andreprevotia sp. IGB-42]|uniref:ABC-type transport auxiliary lipoprotein family protein n=1 Tax=Andreprevotia sp. IGB-42 TaxID=2497473 RepID=UPI0013578090|nr:ABC-type transport auxiliary lipoprotein family protein [Andreprevotia sp. IGB-42]KAF0813046.1 hypothetical protein IGB42_02442 [Andreprevotia sp. IGB-42]
MKNICLILLAGLLGSTLTACSLPTTPPQENNYLLASTRSGAALAQRYDSLRLMPLRAAPPYDTPRFVYRETDQRYVMDPYRGYMAPPAQQISTRLRDWLAASGITAHVVGPGPIAAQHRIEGELTRFDVDLRPGQPRSVSISVRLRLQDEGTQALLVDQTFSASSVLATVTADSIAAAADAALAQVFRDFETALMQAH